MVSSSRKRSRYKIYYCFLSYYYKVSAKLKPFGKLQCVFFISVTFVPREGTNFPGFLGKAKLFCKQVCLIKLGTSSTFSYLFAINTKLSHAEATSRFASMPPFSSVNFMWLQVR